MGFCKTLSLLCQHSQVKSGDTKSQSECIIRGCEFLILNKKRNNQENCCRGRFYADFSGQTKINTDIEFTFSTVYGIKWIKLNIVSNNYEIFLNYWFINLDLILESFTFT